MKKISKFITTIFMLFLLSCPIFAGTLYVYTPGIATPTVYKNVAYDTFNDVYSKVIIVFRYNDNFDKKIYISAYSTWIFEK